MALQHCFYDSTEAQSILGAQIAKYKYGSTLTLTDTAGQNEATISGYVAALTDDSLTDVFVLVDVAATHATGNMLYDDIALLRDKMITASKGTTVTSGTCQANATVTEIILPSGSSAVNDFYNEMYIITAGTTAKARQIKDYVGATVTATVNTTTTAITDTETCIVFTHTNVYLYGARAASGKETGLQMWESAYPSTTAPLVVHFMSYYHFAQDLGAAQASDATTITIKDTADAGGVIADADRANDTFNGMYVYIYSGTGDNQYGIIADYVLSTEVCTLTAAGWLAAGSNTTTPTGTVGYRIMQDSTRLFYDAYTELFIRTYFTDLTKAAALSDFAKLIDKNEKLSLSPTVVDQDLDLLDQYLIKGKAIYDYNTL